MLKNTLLNTGSSVIYFFLQWLTTVLAVRLANFEAAGIYSLAISFSNLFYCLSIFGIRNYQISDVAQRFSGGQYFAARIVTAVIATVVFSAAVSSLGLANYQRHCYIVYMLFKLEEAFTEGYFPLLQIREDYCSLALSYTVKGCAAAAAFAAALLASHDLLTAILGMTAGYGVCILVLDVPCLHKMKIGKPIFRGCMGILGKCAPLMLVSLSVPAMNYITRYAVEAELGNYWLGQYTSLSYVIVVMSTFASTIFIVFVPKVGLWKKEQQWHTIRRFFECAMLAIAALGAVAMAAGVFFGRRVCAWLFGEKILESIGLLLPLLVTATALAGKTFFATMLIPLERRWVLLAGECCGVALCVISVVPLTHRMGMQGANLSYLLGVLLQMVILGSSGLLTTYPALPKGAA